MRNYTTQMDAARKGIITKEMECVAAKEHMDINELVKLVACGQVIIPANKNHKCLDPNGIGSMLRTKINVNLGTSRDCVDLDMELDKVNNAVKMGAEAIMDLSSFGDTQKFRRKLTTVYSSLSKNSSRILSVKFLKSGILNISVISIVSCFEKRFTPANIPFSLRTVTISS